MSVTKFKSRAEEGAWEKVRNDHTQGHYEQQSLNMNAVEKMLPDIARNLIDLAVEIFRDEQLGIAMEGELPKLAVGGLFVGLGSLILAATGHPKAAIACGAGAATALVATSVVPIWKAIMNLDPAHKQILARKLQILFNSIDWSLVMSAAACMYQDDLRPLVLKTVMIFFQNVMMKEIKSTTL